MSDLLRTIAAYVPPGLIRAALNGEPPPTEAKVAHNSAAILFADVSGFTPLTEALAQRGTEGPEELTRLLNRYFGWMIAFAEAEGGEVVKFGGDSLTVVFAATSEPLAMATRRAYQVAQTMQVAMEEFGIMESSVGLVSLKMKVGIGAGQILSAHIGGIDSRWEYIIAGDPLNQATRAEREAQQGQIVLSPQAQAVIAPNRPASRRSIPQIDWSTVADPVMAEHYLRCYTPKPIRTWLDEGLHSWLATLRPMSVLFIGINGLDYEQPKAILKLHNFFRDAQKTVYHYQGSLPRLTVDDKGTVLLVLFGTPPNSHENDPERALRCALDLQALAKKHRLQLAIGATTGRVFAGPVGSNTRREYTVMGDTVNLAARIMIAAGPNQICCNYQTYRSAYEQMSFETLTPIRIKGKTGSISIYRLTGTHDPKWQFDQIKHAEISDPLVGRQAEIAALSTYLDRLETGDGQTVIIEGEAGIGKSRLVGALIRLLEQRGLMAILGLGRSIEQETPYRAWQDIFEAGLDMQTRPSSPSHTPETLANIKRQLENSAPALARYLPVLADILNIALPENENSTALTAAQRQAKVESLLVTLLKRWAERRPLALILENAQWLDAASWKLALRLAQELEQHNIPLLLVLAVRPLEDETANTDLKTLSDLPKTERLRVDTLPPDETLTLAVMSMGLTRNELPEAVAELIRTRAGGNPFFAEELFYFLYDNGYITFKTIQDKTRCLISSDLDRANQTLPATIQNVILSRLDQLPPEKQLMLKIAAVIGPTFEYGTLSYTLNHHMPVSHEQLQTYLEDLTYLDLIRPVAAEPYQTFRFKHNIIREVTYQTLLFDRRRQLHRLVALWHESIFGPSPNEPQPADFSHPWLKLPSLSPEFAHATHPLASYYSPLVYHWHQAEDEEKERLYATLLGEQAMAQFANAEALGYIHRALDLTPKTDVKTRCRLLLARETVYNRRGQREGQQKDLMSLAGMLQALQDEQANVIITLRQAHYAEATGHYAEALHAAQQATRLAQTIKDWVGLGQGYLIQGKIQAARGHFESAQEMAEQALNLAQRANNIHLKAEYLLLMADLNRRQGHYTTAQRYSQQALAIGQMRPGQLLKADALNILGLIDYAQSKFTMATKKFEQAIRIYYTQGNRRDEAKALLNIGLTYLAQQQYETARDYFEQVLDITREIDDRAGTASVLSQLGVTYGKLGDFTTAQSYLGQALGIYKEIDHPLGEAQALSRFGFIYYTLSDIRTTRRYCDLALTIQQKLGDKLGESYSLIYLGHVLVEQNQLKAATTAYNRALELREEMESALLPVDGLVGRAYIYILQENWEQAETQITDVLTWINTHGHTGVDNPHWVYLKSYQILMTLAKQNPEAAAQAQKLLNTAHKTIHKQTDGLSHPKMQRNFLRNIKVHQAIINLKSGKEIAYASPQRQASDSQPFFSTGASP